MEALASGESAKIKPRVSEEVGHFRAALHPDGRNPKVARVQTRREVMMTRVDSTIPQIRRSDMKLFGSLVVALAVVIALGLPTMAQLGAPAVPSGGNVDGGSPGPGQTFVAVAFKITNGATADTLRDILFSNSPASSPAAVGTDVAQIQLYVKTAVGDCADADFNNASGDNGLNDANWTLLQTIPGPLGAGFNTALTTGGVLPSPALT
jgi:hypothetical protein